MSFTATDICLDGYEDKPFSFSFDSHKVAKQLRRLADDLDVSPAEDPKFPVDREFLCLQSVGQSEESVRDDYTITTITFKLVRNRTK
ncbi:MAG TPA: hypothetical protein VN577_10110 [Terriglobales bacterium]|nr:hypothetical protein [Terriglobales bacterium]